MISKLAHRGMYSQQLKLPNEWESLIEVRDFNKLDDYAAKSLERGGILFEKIKSMTPEHIEHMTCGFEHILSLREGPQDEEDDGIWHDDGSRILAFSLSLNNSFKDIEGGQLSLRKKEDRNTVYNINPRPFGTLTVFCTGHEGWEHKTHYVKKGSRLVLAGWLT